MANAIIDRLAEFDAAESLADMRYLVSAQCHELKGSLLGYFAVKISPNYRLIFSPTQQPPPSLDDGGIDWSAVHSITILKIEDYH